MAPTATYEGKMYFFCSVKDRDEFLKDPKMSLSMMLRNSEPCVRPPEVG